MWLWFDDDAARAVHDGSADMALACDTLEGLVRRHWDENDMDRERGPHHVTPAEGRIYRDVRMRYAMQDARLWASENGYEWPERTVEDVALGYIEYQENNDAWWEDMECAAEECGALEGGAK